MDQNIQRSTSMQLSTVRRTNDPPADDEPNSKRQKLDKKPYVKDGLVRSLHGNIYQLKVLMLFLKRASKKGYTFQLSTEVKDAAKFDDVVFVDHDSKETSFVQVKHKQDETEKITAKSLLATENVEKNEYSLQKYFISYREIKKKYTNLGDFILYTNIGFELTDLKNGKIRLDEFADKIIEDILLTPGPTQSHFYKISVDEEHELYKILKEASNLHRLANELKKIIDGKKRSFDLRNEILKPYHVALCEHVFDIGIQEGGKKYVTFRNNFKNNHQLSTEVEVFRSALKSVLEINDDEKFEEKLNSIGELSRSAGFGEAFEFQENPMINKSDVEKLAKKIVEIIDKSNDNTNIKLDRRAPIIGQNIDKLAGHIFVKENLEVVEEDTYILRNFFFDDNEKLGGNLDDFKTALKLELESKHINSCSLENLKFQITKFKTCFENQLTYSNSTRKIEYHELHNLPNDTVKEKEISDYLGALIFAVNQPNEDDLGKIIADELGKDSQFNLLGSDVVGDSFQSKMLAWFKAKRGLPLDATDADKFFKEIEEKVNSLITSGIHLVYPQKLQAYGIEFQENPLVEKLKTFLTTENALILHLFCKEEDTILSAIKICNALEDLKKKDCLEHYLRRDDSHIFIRSNTLKRSVVIKNLVMNAFKSMDCRQQTHNLLIINFEKDVNFNFWKQFLNEIENKQNEWREEQKKYTEKKVILLTTENQTLNDKLNNVFKKIDHQKDDSNFDDFTDVSKKSLLNKRIKFQGAEELITLNQLDVQLSHLKNVDSKTLIKLITDNEIRIGGELQDLGTVANCYMPRKLRHKTYFSEEKIRECNDLFVICGIDSVLSPNINRFHVADNEEAAKDKFQELCDQHRECAIHWLESDSKKLIWYKSHGSMSNLAPLINDDDLVHENDQHKIIIISDKAGMGKSTVLTKISMRLKTDRPDLWVIRINLNDHINVLRKEWNRRKNTGSSVSNPKFDANFLLNELFAPHEHLKLKNNLETELFKDRLSDRGKIVFLIDDFGEISFKYTDIVIELLKSLRETKVERIFVATRINMAKDLEKSLDAFSYALEPISTDEQIEFIVKFWTKNLTLKEDKIEQLKIVSKSIIDKTLELALEIGIPLQSLLIAEIFQDNQNQSLEPTNDQPNQFDLFHLYDRFVRKKFSDWLLVEKRSRWNSEEGISDEKWSENQFLNHELLAICTLFDSLEYEQILSKEHVQELVRIKTSIKNAKHNEGIVDRIISCKPHFIHRSIAEYFASFYIGRKLVDEPSATIFDCINRLVSNTSAIFMIGIIKQLDGKYDIRIEEKPLLHFVIEKQHFNFINSLLESGSNDWAQKLDENGKTPLHYAVDYYSFDTVCALLNGVDDIYEKNILMHGNFKKPEYENSKLVKFINMPDKFGNIALNHAILKSDHDFAFELLLKGSKIESLSDMEINELFQTMLYGQNENSGILADDKYRPIQEKLLSHAPDIFEKLYSRNERKLIYCILSYFFKHGRVEIIKKLLATIGDSRKRKEFLNCVCNYLTYFEDSINDNDRLEIIKYFIEQLGGFPHDRLHVSLVLTPAVNRGHIETFKYLTQFSQDITQLGVQLHNAAACNRFHIIDYIVAQNYPYSEQGRTALHIICALKNPHLKLIKHVIDKGQDINASDNCGETPLFDAIKAKHRLYIIKYLISKGARVDCENSKNETPLSLAIEKEQIELFRYLLGNGAHISERNECYKLLNDKVAFFTNSEEFDLNFELHNAIKTDNLEWAKFLIRNGANINRVDSDGRTPLQWAYERGHMEIEKMLLQNGGIFDSIDISSRTPRENDSIFRLKKLFSSRNVYEELNRYQIDFLIIVRNARNNEQKSLLHIAAEADDLLAIKKILSVHGKNECLLRTIIDAIDVQGNTALHIAAQKNSYEIVSKLMEEGAIFNKNNNNNDTPKVIAKRVLQNKRWNTDALLQSMENLFSAIAISKQGVENCINYLEKQTMNVYLLNYGSHRFEEVKPKIYIKVKNQDGKTLLHLAASIGQSDVVQLLLDKELDIDAFDSNKNTPLHFAAENDKIENVKVLLKNGAFFNAENLDHQTPLDLANREGQSYKLLKLIDTLFQEISSDSPRMNFEIIREKYGVDWFTILNDQNETLLHIAVRLNELSIVKIILENGGIYNVKNKSIKNDKIEVSRMTKLKFQGDGKFEFPYQDIVALLKEIEKIFNDVRTIERLHKTFNRRIIINVRDCDGQSLLHHAAKSNNMRMLNFLKEMGADGNVIDKKGKKYSDYL